MKLKRSGIITKIVIAALLVYAIVTLISVYAKTRAAEAENAALSGQIASTAESNEKMAYRIEHSTDDDVISDIARSEYGLGVEGEHTYYGN